MDTLIHFIYDNGLFAMFLIILLEYACFPVSSEIVLPFSGAVASVQNISFLIILPVSIIAGILGTSLCYLIGRYGGNALLNKITTKFPKTEKGIKSSYQKFEHYGTAIVCFGRMIPICRTYISFIAGAVKQPYPIFLGFSVIGITIWNSLLIGIGYLLGANWEIATLYYTKYKDILIPVLLIILLIVIYIKLRKKKVDQNPCDPS